MLFFGAKNNRAYYTWGHSMGPMEGGNQTSYKSRVILRDFPKITMKCLGWCPVVAPVAEESLFFSKNTMMFF